MKKMFLAFAFASMFVAAKAQDGGAVFGLKGGLNLANLKSKAGDESESGDMKPGFHIGAYANVPLSANFSFNPELLYSGEGAKEEEDGGTAKINLNYLNVPLLVQYNASGFYAETGPQLGLLLSAKSKFEDDGEEEDVDIKDDLNSTSFSWAIGVGFKTASGFGAGARYNLGLSNLIKDGDDDFKWTSNVIQIGVSYTLGKK